MKNAPQLLAFIFWSSWPAVISAEEFPFPIAEFLAANHLKSSFSSGAGKAPDNDRIYDNRLAQSFTTSGTGRVVSVEIVVRPINQDSPAPLKVAIHQLKDGLPGKELASSSIKFATIPDGEELRERLQSRSFTAKATFEKQPRLWGGRQYCLVFSSSVPPANYHLSGTSQSDVVYPYGVMLKGDRKGGFEVSADGDLFFRVTAMPVDLWPVLALGGFVILAVGFGVGYLVANRGKAQRAE